MESTESDSGWCWSEVGQTKLLLQHLYICTLINGSVTCRVGESQDAVQHIRGAGAVMMILYIDKYIYISYNQTMKITRLKINAIHEE